MKRLEKAVSLTLAALMALTLFASAVSADDWGNYSVSGHVVSAGGNKTPLSGAQLTINSKTVLTDDAGFYEFKLPNGTYTVVVTKSGYQKHTGQLTVNGTDFIYDLEMKSSAMSDSGCDIIWPVVLVPVAALAIVRFRKAG